MFAFPFRFRRLQRAGVVLIACASLGACASDEPSTASIVATTAVPTSAATTRSPLTPYEQVACGNWAVLKREVQAHTANDADIFRRLQFKVANKAGVDSEGGAVHRAALAGVQAIQDDTLHPESARPGAFTDAVRELNDACERHV